MFQLEVEVEDVDFAVSKGAIEANFLPNFPRGLVLPSLASLPPGPFFAALA